MKGRLPRSSAVADKLSAVLLALALAWNASQNATNAQTIASSFGNDLDRKRILLASAQAPGEAERAELSDLGLSPGAHEIAVLTGILPLYKRLQNEQKKAAQSNISTDELDALRQHQRIIYLHANIGQCLQTMECQLRRSMAVVDSESANLSELKASLADERSRVQHHTSLANMVSGGATRIGAYSTGLVTPTTLPINVLEIFDGVVQIGLSSVMIHQEHKERRVDKLTTETITTFLDSAKTNPANYPEAVWEYLIHPLPGRKDGKSRRQLVIESWTDMRRIEGSTESAPPTLLGKMPRLHPTRSTERSLDVTLAMMADIKAALSSMEASIAELSEAVKNSYAGDPAI